MAVCGILATLMGLDRIRFSFEADAASVAAILPEQESQPAEETQPAPAPAQEVEAAAAPQPKPKRTRKPKALSKRNRNCHKRLRLSRHQQRKYTSRTWSLRPCRKLPLNLSFA